MNRSEKFVIRHFIQRKDIHINATSISQIEILNNRRRSVFQFGEIFRILRRIVVRHDEKRLRSWLPLLVRKVFSRSWVHRRMQETLREYQGQSRCHVLMSHDNKLRCNAKDVFGLPARMEFEGIEANVPSQPEQFLTDIYGDNYMMLPPKEERVSHFHAYCDLNTPYKTTNFEELRRKVGLEKPSTK